MATQTIRGNRRKKEAESTSEVSIPSSRSLSKLEAHEDGVNNLLKVIDTLEKRGLLEPAIGLLEDEKTFSEIMILLTSDDTLNIIQNAKAIIRLFSILDYDSLNQLAQTAQSKKQVFAGLSSTIHLLNALESRGLLEPLVGLLNDEATFSNLARIVSSDDALTLIANIPNLIRLSNLFDPQLQDELSKSVIALKKDVKPVKGVFGVIGQLSDPAVARGLGRVFEVLRVLGEQAPVKKE